MIGPRSTNLRRVEFWLALYEWLVAYNTVARLCYVTRLYTRMQKVPQLFKSTIFIYDTTTDTPRLR